MTNYFRNAFPRMTERLGIVYTPIEVVDFIIHSVEHVLKTDFNSSMADENVHILDPFTGTGTFIARLLQSGIIPEDRLPEKYRNEIHANELVLLAYYIAAINIEATYHGILTGNITGQEDSDVIFEPAYEPFNGICLTDTFQMGEKADLVDELLEVNSARRKRQQELDIRVIIGNPPYSAGQESANDNNANVQYLGLDERIRSTYAARSSATNKNALYDSYIRAIRWSSDRIKDRGVIGFVTNGGFVEANTADGLRKCLVEEFSNLYVFHLRGNQRTSGERSRKEGGKIFGSGSRSPIAISILIKNPESKDHGKIHFHDIGDYLTREQKLEMVSEFGSIAGISRQEDASSLLSFSETSPGIRDGMADSGFVLMSYYPKEFPVSNLVAELSMMVKLENIQESTSGLAFMGALADFVFNYCEECVDEFAAQNQVFTSASASDNYMLQCNKPVATLEQLNGKRIRTSGPHWARWVEHVGATPVTMSVSDQYEALNQGVLDCTITSGVDMDIFKIKEVVTDLTPGIPGGVYGATAFNNINRDVWKSLTVEQRKQALHASAAGASKVSMDYHVGAAKEVAAANSRGITIHEPADELKEVTQSFIRADISRIAMNYSERHGVELAEEKVAKFRELLVKWANLVRDVDDVDTLTDIYWKELYSKVDVSNYAL